MRRILPPSAGITSSLPARRLNRPSAYLAARQARRQGGRQGGEWCAGGRWRRAGSGGNDAGVQGCRRKEGDVQSLKLLCSHGGGAHSQYVILWLLWQPANLQRPTEGVAAVGLWLRAGGGGGGDAGTGCPEAGCWPQRTCMAARCCTPGWRCCPQSPLAASAAAKAERRRAALARRPGGGGGGVCGVAREAPHRSPATHPPSLPPARIGCGGPCARRPATGMQCRRSARSGWGSRR